jgi:hypothetical protein
MVLAIAKEWWLELTIALITLIGFGYVCYQIGWHSAYEENAGATKRYLDDTSASNRLQSSNLAAVNSVADESQTNSAFGGQDTDFDLLDSADSPRYAVVYGSINGTKFYNYGCKAGNRIKEENKIFFANAGKALAAGYEPSVSCDF